MARITREGNELIVIFNDKTPYHTGVTINPAGTLDEITARVEDAKNAAKQKCVGNQEYDKLGELVGINNDTTAKYIMKTLKNEKAVGKIMEKTLGKAPAATPAQTTKKEKAAAPPPVAAAPKPKVDTTISKPAPVQARGKTETPVVEKTPPPAAKKDSVATKTGGVPRIAAIPTPTLLTGATITPAISTNWIENQLGKAAVDSLYLNKAAVDRFLQTKDNQTAATAMVYNSLAKQRAFGLYLSSSVRKDSTYGELNAKAPDKLPLPTPDNLIKPANRFIRDFLLVQAAGRDSTYHRELEQVDGISSRLRNIDKWKAAKGDVTAQALVKQQCEGSVDAATLAAATLYQRRKQDPNASFWRAPQKQAQQPQPQKAPEQQPKQVEQPKPVPEPKRIIPW